MTFFDGEVAQAAQPRSTTAGVGVAEISHRAIRDLVSDLVEGSLDERELGRVSTHLQSCPDCRAWCETLHATARAVSALPREQAPRALKDRLARLSEP